MEFISKKLSRFLEIRTVVEKILKDLDYSSKCLDKNEASLTKNLKETPKIIEIEVTAFFRNNVTLLKCEKIFVFEDRRKLDRLLTTCWLLHFKELNKSIKIIY